MDIKLTPDGFGGFTGEIGDRDGGGGGCLLAAVAVVVAIGAPFVLVGVLGAFTSALVTYDLRPPDDVEVPAGPAELVGGLGMIALLGLGVLLVVAGLVVPLAKGSQGGATWKVVGVVGVVAGLAIAVPTSMAMRSTFARVAPESIVQPGISGTGSGTSDPFSLDAGEMRLDHQVGADCSFAAYLIAPDGSTVAEVGPFAAAPDGSEASTSLGRIAEGQYTMSFLSGEAPECGWSVQFVLEGF